MRDIMNINDKYAQSDHEIILLIDDWERGVNHSQQCSVLISTSHVHSNMK